MDKSSVNPKKWSPTLPWKSLQVKLTALRVSLTPVKSFMLQAPGVAGKANKLDQAIFVKKSTVIAGV